MDNFNLEIEDFGVINEAKIGIGKINVVGGVNGSGKSTASKLLYCFLRSLSLTRNDFILKSILPDINEFINNASNPHPYAEHGLPDRFSEDDDIDDILKAYEEAEEHFDDFLDIVKIPEELFYDMRRNIRRLIPILKDNSKENYSAVLKSLFKSESLLVFKGKTSFYNDSFRAVAYYEDSDDYNSFLIERYLDLKSKNIDFDDVDERNVYNSDDSFDFIPNVIYFDSISIFDLQFYLNKVLYEDDDKRFPEYKEHIEHLLNDLNDKSEVSEEIEEKIRIVEDKLKRYFKGYYSTFHELSPDIPAMFSYAYLRYLDKIQANISSGVQQIGILENLLMGGKLIPGTFLIIDEPEVNLHPEWQFKFAEILVLLAKELDITIYLNSHSPMFIEAIEVLTQYYDLEEVTNFYLMEKSDGDGYDFVKIDYENLYDLYDNLAKPFDAIEAYRLKSEYKKGNY